MVDDGIVAPGTCPDAAGGDATAWHGCRPKGYGHIVDRGGIRRPARRLRSILPDATIVKLDIEGAEFEVLPAQIDDLPAPRVWIVEIHPARGRDPATVLDAFRGLERHAELFPW